MLNQKINIGKHEVFFRAYKSRKPKSKIPVVLIHGLSMSSKYMIPLAEEMSTYYDVYVPDLPGFGESSKPRSILGIRELSESLYNWMKEMGISKAVFVGNSLGCQVIVDLVITYPKMCTHAVLIGPTVDNQDRSFIGQAFRLFRDGIREPISSYIPALVDGFKAGPIRSIKTAQKALNDSIERKIKKIQLPILIIRGEKDTVVSQEWVEKLNSVAPDSHLVIIPQKAHAVNYSGPKEVMKIILKFLDK